MTMYRSMFVFAMLVVFTTAFYCEYPCPTPALYQPVCGKQIASATVTYHTFTWTCQLECHAQKHPTRAYAIVGEIGKKCEEQGFSEGTITYGEPNEFEFPYEVIRN